VAGSIPFLQRFVVQAETETKPNTTSIFLEETSKEPLASFFLLSDLHITVDATSMTDKLHLALQDITNWDSKLDAIILGGDLTDFGRLSDYLLLKKILNQYELPQIYGNMGNHDYYDIWLTSNGDFSTETMPNGKKDAMSRQRFQNFLAYGDRPYTDAWINDVHLIMVSQEAYVEERPEVGEGAWYSDEQLDWLRETMKSHVDGKPSIVFIHQPLPSPGSDGRTHQMIRANEFREILKPFKNVFVLSGHTHRSFGSENHYNWENSFHWFNNASVGRTRSLIPDQTSETAQGMYIEVYAHQVVVRGREFTSRTWIDNAAWTIPLLK
jgi:3',5'-cyclic AMP phosphodiesterase CpdA